MKIKVAHSPDSDDAFMFYAIAHKKIDTGNFDFEITSDEIQVLNQKALDSDDYDICAVSFHAYAYISDRYQILKAGSSMGDQNYGPRVVCSEELADKLVAGKFSEAEYKNKVNLKGLKIAIPGELTSAYLCLSLYQKQFAEGFEPYFCKFDEVFDLVKSGKVDAALLIHESQLKFTQESFALIVDLGNWWFHQSNDGFAMPLGCNVIKRSLGTETVNELSRILQESISYGLEHFDDALDYARKFSKNGLDDAKAKEYISMYVNEHTLSLSDSDLSSIRSMLEKAYQSSLLKVSDLPILDPV